MFKIADDTMAAPLSPPADKTVSVKYPLHCAVSAAAAFFMTGVKVGGISSPFVISFAAALSPCAAASAFAGALFSAAVRDKLSLCSAELAAMLVMTVFSFIFKRRRSISRWLTAAVCTIICFVSCCAFYADTPLFIVFAAQLIRAVLCGCGCLCFSCAIPLLSSDAKVSRLSLRLFSAAVCYTVVICSMCSFSAGLFTAGKIAAGAACCIGARKFGVKGGGAVGILSAVAFLLFSPAEGRAGVMLAFAGFVSGAYSSKGKYKVNIAFVLTGFLVCLSAGMPSGTPSFIADLCVGAAVYCFVPENIYFARLNILSTDRSRSAIRMADGLQFAGMMLREVDDDVNDASKMLRGLSENHVLPLRDQVREKVCRTACGGKCSAAFGCAQGSIADNCFSAAENILRCQGAIDEGKLPAGFEGCRKKRQLSACFNTLYGTEKIQTKRSAFTRRLLENLSEELDCLCGMLDDIAADTGRRALRDTDASGKAAAVIGKHVGSLMIPAWFKSADVTFDDDGHIFCEAYIYADEGLSEVHLTALTDSLGEMLGTDLEKPVITGCGSASDGCGLPCSRRLLYRVRWRESAGYFPDYHVAASPAAGSTDEITVSGDSYTAFEDGLGCFYLILADGMGTGCRAAAESGMAVNLLRRLILSGAGRFSAVRLLNTLLAAMSADETFTTVDMLWVDCFTGKGGLVKMGSAPTAVLTEGDISFYSEAQAPVGIFSRAEPIHIPLSLDSTSRVLMMTDGVIGDTSPDSAPACDFAQFTRAVLENERLSCQQSAEKLLSYALGEQADIRDDITAAAFRLYSI